MIYDTNLNIEFIKKKLQQLKCKDIDHPLFKKSAILIPFFYNEQNELTFLMTARSRKLKKHAGEMSFPGGSFEPEHDKDLVETALRETEEEIGLNPSEIDIMGRLDDFPTITGYIIRPFIGFFHSKNKYGMEKQRDSLEDSLTINHGEVVEVVEIPLKYLFTPNLFVERKFPDSTSSFHILSFTYHWPKTNKSYTIWGASAHILAEFLSNVFDYEVRSPSYRRPNLQQLIHFREQYKREKRKKT